jgi:hypothetical protein
MRLSRPHLPRVYRGRPWLLSSGTGRYASIDPCCGTFVPPTFGLRYLRGLALAGKDRVVEQSRPRRGPVATTVRTTGTALCGAPRCSCFGAVRGGPTPPTNALLSEFTIGRSLL